MNREEWLTAAAGHIAKQVLEPAGLRSMTPRDGQDDRRDWSELRVSTSFPSKKALSLKNRTIGQCWAPEASSKGLTEVFISPVLEEPVRVLDVLTHEMVHACMPQGTKHGPQFAAACRAVGLEGKPTATAAGPELTATLEMIATVIGPYPHAAIDQTLIPKQATRQLKAACVNEACESGQYAYRPGQRFQVRITQQWWNAYGPEMVCPACGEGLELSGGKEE